MSFQDAIAQIEVSAAQIEQESKPKFTLGQRATGAQQTVFDPATGQPLTLDPVAAQKAIEAGTASVPADAPINIVGPDGMRGAVQGAQLQEALKAGFRLESPREGRVQDYLQQNAGLSGTLKVAGGKAASELAFGVPEIIAEHVMAPEEREKWEALKEEHKAASVAGSVAGFAGSMLYGGPLFKGAASAGKAAEAAVKGGQATVGLGRSILAGAAKLGAEGAVISAPQVVTEAALGDPKAAAEHLIWGLGGGAVLGAAGAAVKPAVKGLGKLAEGALEHFGVEPGAANPLKSLSETQAFRSLMHSADERGTKLAQGAGGPKELGRYVLDEGLLRSPGESFEKYAARVAERKATIGEQIGAKYKDLDAAGAMGPSAEDLAAKFRTEVIDPLRAKSTRAGEVQKLESYVDDFLQSSRIQREARWPTQPQPPGSAAIQPATSAASIPPPAKPNAPKSLVSAGQAEESSVDVAANSIEPPHEVRDTPKLESLVESYKNGEDVPPVVILNYDGELKAINGSHRIEAMREAFGDELVPSKYAVVVDSEAAKAALDLVPDKEWSYGHTVLKNELNDPGSWGDLDELTWKLKPFMPERAAASIEAEQVANRAGKATPVAVASGAAPVVSTGASPASQTPHGQPLFDLWETRKDLAARIYQDRKAIPGSIQNPIDRAQDRFREMLDEAIETSAGKDFTADIRELNRHYRKLSTIEDIVETSVKRAAKNRDLSLSDMIFGGHLGIAAAVHSPLGILTGIGGAVAHKMARESGNAIVAKYADQLGTYFAHQASQHANTAFSRIPQTLSTMAAGKPAELGSVNSFHLFLGDEAAKRRTDAANFDLVAKQLQDAAADPKSQARVQAVADVLAKGAPGVAQAYVQSEAARAQWLLQQLPKAPPPQPFAPPWKPGKRQVADFKDTLRIAMDPHAIFDEMAKGTITPRHVAAVKAAWPASYERMVAEVKSWGMQPKGTKLPYRKQLAIAMLTGEPLTPGMRDVAAFQSNFVQEAQAEAQQASQGAPSRLGKLPGSEYTEQQRIRS